MEAASYLARPEIDQSGRRINWHAVVDGPVRRWVDLPPAEQAVFHLARKLTDAPSLVSDADVEALRRHYKDNEVAELVYHVCNAAFFDRLTEAAGLRLEEK